MTVIAVICALATTMCIGYYFGRRATSTRPSWRKRTSRMAMGKLAISLLAMITARRIQRRLRSEQLLSGKSVLRAIAPLELLRGSVVRLRSY